VAYLESIPPGTNRRSHYKALKKLWRWAYQLGHVDAEPMARMRPMDAWGANVDFLSVRSIPGSSGSMGKKSPPNAIQGLASLFCFGRSSRASDVRNGAFRPRRSTVNLGGYTQQFVLEAGFAPLNFDYSWLF
jgi:hypothetical protein